MGDPQFAVKLRQIQQYWHSAVTSGTVSAPEVPLAGIDGLGAPRPAAPLPAGHYRSRVRFWDIASNACFALAGLMALALLVATPWLIGPAIRATEGRGTVGVFTARDQQCSQECFWIGTFRSARGIVLHDAEFGDTAPSGTHSGSSFPALWPAGFNDVFAAHGSTGWITFVLADVLACAVLGALTWYGPVRYLRKRRWRGRRSQP